MWKSTSLWNGTLHDNKTCDKTWWEGKKHPFLTQRMLWILQRSLFMGLIKQHFLWPWLTPSCPQHISWPQHPDPPLPTPQCTETHLFSVTVIHPDLHIMVTASTFPLINSPERHFPLQCCIIIHFVNIYHSTRLSSPVRTRRVPSGGCLHGRLPPAPAQAAVQGIGHFTYTYIALHLRALYLFSRSTQGLFFIILHPDLAGVIT